MRFRSLALAAVFAMATPVVILLAPASCSLDGLAGGPSVGGGGGSASNTSMTSSSSSSATSSTSGGMDAGCPPEMTSIDKSYCIDNTEVTTAQYFAFLATKPSLGGQ